MVTSGFAENHILCAQFPGPVLDNTMVTIPCNPAARGQYVTITTPGLSKELALCEVIVFTELGNYIFCLPWYLWMTSAMIFIRQYVYIAKRHGSVIWMALPNQWDWLMNTLCIYTPIPELCNAIQITYQMPSRLYIMHLHVNLSNHISIHNSFIMSH